jgi:hypothetical protein
MKYLKSIIAQIWSVVNDNFLGTLLTLKENWTPWTASFLYIGRITREEIYRAENKGADFLALQFDK